MNVGQPAAITKAQLKVLIDVVYPPDASERKKRRPGRASDVLRKILEKALPKKGKVHSQKFSADDIESELGRSGNAGDTRRNKKGSPSSTNKEEKGAELAASAGKSNSARFATLAQDLRKIIGDVKDRTSKQGTEVFGWPDSWKPYPLYHDAHVYFLVNSNAAAAAWNAELPSKAIEEIKPYLRQGNPTERELAHTLGLPEDQHEDNREAVGHVVPTTGLPVGVPIERISNTQLNSLRRISITEAAGSLASSFDPNVYVDRGNQHTFKRFLSTDDCWIFPVFGQAGIGKTWELCALSEHLPERILPVVISARFLRPPLVSEVESRLRKQIGFTAEAADGGGMFDSWPARLPRGWSVIVFLDGLNEYHFSVESELSLVRDILELFEWVESRHAKTVLSCRTFAWQNVLSDESLLKHMFISSQERRKVLTTDYRDGQEPWEREIKEEVITKYGIELGPYSLAERQEYWQNLGQDITQLGPSAVKNLLSIDDPFLCGIAAEHLLQGRSIGADTASLLTRYVSRRCRDKGTEASEHENHASLMALTSHLIRGRHHPPDRMPFEEVVAFLAGISLETYIERRKASNLLGKLALDRLVNTGLIVDYVPDYKGQNAVAFRHDRVFEHSVCRYLFDMCVAGLRPIQEKAWCIFELFRRSHGAERHQDYLLNIARLMARKLISGQADQGAFGDKSNFDLGQAFLLALRFLYQRIPTSLYGYLFKLLDHPVFGLQVALLLRDKGNAKELDRLLSGLLPSPSWNIATANTVVAAPAASRAVASSFLGSLEDCKDPIIRVRSAWALGHIGDAKCSPILLKWLDDDKGAWTSVKNACLWALEEIGYRLPVDLLVTLGAQGGAAWSVSRYIIEGYKARPQAVDMDFVREFLAQSSEQHNPYLPSVVLLLERGIGSLTG